MIERGRVVAIVTVSYDVSLALRDAQRALNLRDSMEDVARDAVLEYVRNITEMHDTLRKE